MSYDKTYEDAQEWRRLCESGPWHCEGNAASVSPSPSLLDDGDGSVLATGAVALQQIEKPESRDKGPNDKDKDKDKAGGLDKGRSGWRMREPQLHRRRH